MKTCICQKFNELYPDGVEPPVDWTSPKQMEIIKFKARSRGIEKDKLKLKLMIKELKVQAEKDRQALKRPPLIEQEIQLKYGEVALDNDEKKLIEYGRIKDGSILQFARKLTAYHAIKMNEK